MNALHKHFRLTLLLSIVLVLVALGATTWYALSRNSAHKTANISSFKECVSAGNPVMESYPPRCNANGKTFTDESVESASLMQDVTSAKGAFTIGIPRGWGPVVSAADVDQLMMNGDKQPKNNANKSVEVNKTEFYGHDGPIIFLISVSDVVDMSLPNGDVSTFTIGKGEDMIAGKRYAYTYPADTAEGIGARLAGDRDYNYQFTLKDGRFLRASYHVYGSDPHNLVQTFEQSLKTLRINTAN